MTSRAGCLAWAVYQRGLAPARTTVMRFGRERTRDGSPSRGRSTTRFPVPTAGSATPASLCQPARLSRHIEPRPVSLFTFGAPRVIAASTPRRSDTRAPPSTPTVSRVPHGLPDRTLPCPPMGVSRPDVMVARAVNGAADRSASDEATDRFFALARPPATGQSERGRFAP